MPRGRKRKDPIDAPIDGDYAQDRIVNKQAGWKYLLLSEEDVPRYKAMGATLEERGPDSARPEFASGTEEGSGYKVGNLTLYKIPEELADRFDRRAQQIADQRSQSLGRFKNNSDVSHGRDIRSEVII